MKIETVQTITFEEGDTGWDVYKLFGELSQSVPVRGQVEVEIFE